MSDSEEDLDCVNWWLDFMADAGIPPNAAAQYAVNFADQRIPRDKEIITELSSDEWRDLGVELLGDRLALKNFAKVKNFDSTYLEKDFFRERTLCNENFFI